MTGINAGTLNARGREVQLQEGEIVAREQIH